MNRASYHQQAINMLGWIFGWYKGSNRNYVVPNGFQIHHIDHNHTNNSLDNLIILTVEEHMAIHEIDRATTNGKHSKSIVCVETGIVYESISDASNKTGIARTNISKVCSGKPKFVTAGGYHWRYVD